MTASKAGRSDAARYKPYPAYKASGVEWLGEIPAHWQVKKVKRLCLVRRGASPRPIDDPIYFDDDGECAWVRIADVTASDRYLERTTQRLSALGKAKSVALDPGELFLSIAATVGKPVITKIKCCIHDGFVYFVGLREDREYLYYLFSCGEPYKGLGKQGTQLNLNTDTIGDIFLPLPSGREQQVIVDFIDRETARIDALVAKNERLIELLHEKRAALITQAVTKGINPNAPMKDAGVEWLGEIPANWGVKRLWHLTPTDRRIMYGIVLPGPNVHDGVPIVKGGDVSPGCLRLDRLNRTTVEIESGHVKSRLRGGDLVFAIRGSIGEVAVVPGELEGANLTQDAARIAYTAATHGPWLLQALKSAGVFAQLEAGALGATIRGINIRDLKRASIPVPPRPEQATIAAFLDRETAKVDALVAKARDAIDHLKELRTALVSAAVTGKIDVRSTAIGAAANEGGVP